MGKRMFKLRKCEACPSIFQPQGTRCRWCSLDCRLRIMTDRSGGESSCWPWIGSRDPHGYGYINIDGNIQTAHRVAFFRANSISPDSDIKVRHSCDNPPCCNPTHLLGGSQADNVRDMINRGRQQDYSTVRRGSAHGMSKITEETALAIFQAHGRQADIMTRFGVSRTMLQRIRSGRTWNHVTGLPKR